ncbi:zinc finger BED domain-containing protein 1-like [Anguilla anguilla]|uniref:zinc finger BED domain-containing protein 1-like n=1 Tax=Anguilla anguilla TaxID=7936 RepID=UPI0015A920B5|nr:zinc finger BED domain-containing protein 1-like [Anguilla anguilla]
MHASIANASREVIVARKMANADSESLVSKKGANSSIWQCFGFVGDENGDPLDTDTPICKLCMKSVAAKGGNTSNLRTHLKNNHPLNASRLPVSADQPRFPRTTAVTQTTGPFTRSSKCDKDSHRWNLCTSAVTRFLVKEMLPFRTVEKPAFRDLLKTFNPHYEPPCRNFFADKAIPELYDQIRQDVLCLLSHAEYYALTTDMWSSVGMTTYMSLTVHFITRDWKLQTKCLETCFFPSDHTASNICAWLREAVCEWGLEDSRISGITIDNAPNLMAAAKDLGWPLVTCFGRNVDLAVNLSIQAQKRRTDRVFGLCRSIAGAFSHSWRRKRALIKAQAELGLPQHSLITDCATGWGSKQEMVARIIEQKQAIQNVLADDPKASLTLRRQDTDMLTAVNEALKPVAEFTSVLSGETHVTSSSVIPMLSLIREDVMAPSDDDVALTAEIKAAIVRKLDGKYADEAARLLLRKCTCVDPRYGGTFEASDELKQVIAGEIAALRRGRQVAVRVKEEEEEEQEEEDTREGQAAVAVKEENRSERQAGIRVKEEHRIEAGGEDTSAEQPPAKKMRTLGSLLGKRTTAAASSVDELAKAEIGAYLMEPVIEGDSDPLQWWQLNEHRYPTLSQLARRYLCICATSTAPERLFSPAGNVVISSRAQLTPDKVNMLVFLDRNLA